MARIDSVDTFRFVSIVAVITLHTLPFRSDSFNSEAYFITSVVIDQVARFAVPFFFIISGYFWGWKISNSEAPLLVSLDMSKRLFTIFIIWSIIYILPYNLSSMYDYGLLGPIKLTYWKIKLFLENPMKLVMQGTKIHLWFLIALVFSLTLSTILILFSKNKYLLFLVGLFFFIIGVLGKSYSQTPIGLDIGFNTRNGPFFGTLFFITGYILSGIKNKENWLYIGVLITFIGYLVQFTEIILLYKLYSISPYHDYVFGTYFIGLGIALVSLSDHPILQINTYSSIGKITLGIYAVHFIFIDLFEPLSRILNNGLWEIANIIVVTLFSIYTIRFAYRYKLLRKYIS